MVSEYSSQTVKHSTGRRRILRMSREFLNTFGKRIMILRRDHGLTQEQLAELLEQRYGVTVRNTWISTLEAAKTNKMPATDVVVALAKALNTTTDYLLLVSDDAKKSKNNDEPVYISPQADEAANLIDELRDPIWRDYCVAAIKQLVKEYEERQKALVAVTRQLDKLKSHGATELVAQIERELNTLATLADRELARARLDLLVSLFGNGS